MPDTKCTTGDVVGAAVIATAALALAWLVGYVCGTGISP